MKAVDKIGFLSFHSLQLVFLPRLTYRQAKAQPTSGVFSIDSVFVPPDVCGLVLSFTDAYSFWSQIFLIVSS